MNPIYKPKGAAAEYGDYAVNIYTGCPHRCYYCFAPQVLHREREVFHSCVRDYKYIPGTQLINLSSCGGYTIVPTAVTYCATKFYVSAFTEGLARELIESGAKMRAKVLAPAATQTEFGKKANNVQQYDYDKAFGTYHTSQQMAEFLLRLYDSSCTLGIVDRETFKFELRSPMFPYANGSAHNQAPRGCSAP